MATLEIVVYFSAEETISTSQRQKWYSKIHSSWIVKYRRNRIDCSACCSLIMDSLKWYTSISSKWETWMQAASAVKEWLWNTNGLWEIFLILRKWSILEFWFHDGVYSCKLILIILHTKFNRLLKRMIQKNIYKRQQRFEITFIRMNYWFSSRDRTAI